MPAETLRKSRRIVVRRSTIHGNGVFATTLIPEGTRLIEYKGERVSGDIADEDADDESSHTFLFMLDNAEVIDGTRNGNSARWINHSCTPNCEGNEENGRVFIDVLGDVQPGEEITIDYNLYVDGRYTQALKRMYACICGTDACRGTLLGSKR